MGKVTFLRQMIKGTEGTPRIMILELGESKSLPQGKDTVKSGRDKKVIVADRGQFERFVKPE